MALIHAKAKGALRRAIALACSLCGVAWLWRHMVPKPTIRILAYHGVEPSPDNHFSVSSSNFEKQIQFLSKNYKIISVDTLARYLKNEESPQDDLVVLTFDDGYRNFLTHAVPILQRYTLPATCFVIASKVEGDDPRFMSVEDIEQVVQSGLITIGSHSLAHRSIRQATANERITEVQGSKEWLERALGRTVKYFCYPYGTRNDFDEDCAALVKKSGFHLAFTSINGLNTAKTNGYKLRRTKIEAGNDIRTFQRILAGALDVWFFVDLLLFTLQRRRRVHFG